MQGIETVVQYALTEIGVPVSRLGKRSRSEDGENIFTVRRRVLQQVSDNAVLEDKPDYYSLATLVH
jgi:hypothetical protein